jgi:maltose alpha-D-glucosyltransferase/alpha-amylase
MRRLIALRKRFRAFGRGTLEFLMPENRKVLAFLREYEEERILVIANLSRFAQYAELDLSRFRGMVPVELFGHTEFPQIGELPYFITLGPHQFHWFSVEPQRTAERAPARPPTVRVSGRWDEVLSPSVRGVLERGLPAYLENKRWFGSKARRIKQAEIVEALPVRQADEPQVSGDGYSAAGANEIAGHLAMVRVDYVDGDPETYVLPLACAGPERSRDIRKWQAGTVVANVEGAGGLRALYDGLWDPAMATALLEIVAKRRRLTGARGKLSGTPGPKFRELREAPGDGLQPFVISAEQSNTSLVFGDRLILKLIRRLEAGINPELEVGRFLTDAGFQHVPPMAGSLEYATGESEPMTVGILEGYVPNEGDAWSFTLDALAHYLEEVLARVPTADGPFVERPALLELARTDPPAIARETIGAYLESARLLGRRTAQLHLALASNHQDTAFAPEPFSILYQRSLYQSLRAPAVRTFRLLRASSPDDPQLGLVLSYEGEILERYRSVLDRKIDATRTRCHGDYHLGQVLWTGKDFVIIDFEGEPALPLGERRIKRSPLRDVAGMIRSFHYAVHTALGRAIEEMGGPAESSLLSLWADFWYLWLAAAFLRSYLNSARGASFLPSAREDLSTLLDVFLLEKAVYELRYEANNRPDWIHIPARGILEQLGGAR